MFKNSIIGVVLASTVAATAFAHSGATGIVKKRMDAMMAMGTAVKTIAPMMRSEIEYDASAILAAAEIFSDHSGQAMTNLFPEGTGGGASTATSDIWTNATEFAALAQQLGDYADGLALAAGNGISASMAGQDTMMGTSSSSDMMGETTMMGVTEAMMDFTNMPADAAFNLVAQTCASCHATFRAKD